MNQVLDATYLLVKVDPKEILQTDFLVRSFVVLGMVNTGSSGAS